MLKGFTLIEVITAITVIAIGVVGAFSVVQTILSFSSASSYQLTAIYLAQEGNELIRNIRDTNWLEGDTWDNGIVCCPIPPCECEVDYTSSALDPWTEPGRFLRIEGGFYIYAYAAGNETTFKRKILILPELDILHVTTTVSWQEKGISHEINVPAALYNWR